MTQPTFSQPNRPDYKPGFDVTPQGLQSYGPPPRMEKPADISDLMPDTSTNNMHLLQTDKNAPLSRNQGVVIIVLLFVLTVLALGWSIYILELLAALDDEMKKWGY